MEIREKVNKHLDLAHAKCYTGAILGAANCRTQTTGNIHAGDI